MNPGFRGWLLSSAVMVTLVVLLGMCGGCGDDMPARMPPVVQPPPDPCAHVSAVTECFAFVAHGVRGPMDKGLCASVANPQIIGCTVDIANVYGGDSFLVDCVESCEQP